MKELKLAIQLDFSDCAIEDSTQRIAEEIKKIPFLLELTVSVFDAASAVHMMIDNRDIRSVHVTRTFREGRFLLADVVNRVQVIGGID